MAVARTGAVAALVILAAGLGLYLMTRCPTVHLAGTGENATAAATLGVPHPPGFPLFCLAGRVAVIGAPGSPAAAVNTLVAVLGAAAAAVVAGIAAGLMGSLAAGLGSGFLLLTARTFWGQATIAEVYTLSALLLAIELGLVLAWRGDLAATEASAGGRASDSRLLVAFGFVLGVGLSVHPLHALMVPGYAWLLASGARRQGPAARRRIWPALAFAVLATALGLTLHLYTPLRSAADPVLDWGDPETQATFFRYLTGAQYRGRMFSLGGAGIAANLERFGEVLWRQWTPFHLLLPLVGFAVLWRSRRELAIGLGLLALADVGFALNYDIPWEIEVYYIPLVMILALAGGVGIAGLATRARRAGPAVAAAGVVFAALPGVLHFAELDRRNERLIDDYGRDVLDSLPADAVLVTPPANPTFILLYLTAVEGARPDLKIYVEGEHGLAPLGEALRPGARPLVTPASLAADSDRHPVFYAERDPLDDLPGFELEPAGAVYRLRRSGATADAFRDPIRLRVDPERDVTPADDFHLRLVAAHYLVLRAEVALAAGDTAAAADEIARARSLGSDLASVDGAIGLALAASGDRAGAAVAYERALAVEEVGSLANRLGRLRLELGDTAAAEAAFRRAIVLDPKLAMAHSNLGALLGQRGDYAGAVAELEQAVTLDPTSTKAHNNLGMAFLLAGQPARAVAEFRRSLALNPEQPAVRGLLARAEAETTRPR